MDISEIIMMLNERKKITLSDLMNINFLQKLQDDFAKAMGIASITVDDNGPITKPSNFTDFCTKHIYSNNGYYVKLNICVTKQLCVK